jgi:hypothetical protein
MGRIWKEVAEKIIESVENYNMSVETIAPLVKVYADKNLKDWQHFSGWNFIDGGRNIKINYSYEDFWSNTEYYTEFDSISVPLIDIIKVMDDYITVKMKEE